MASSLAHSPSASSQQGAPGIFIPLQERLGAGFWASLGTVASCGASHPCHQLKGVFCLLLLTEAHQNLLPAQLDLPQGVRDSALSQ